MQVSGLFSGIGGFELAFSQAGFSTAMLVEIDPAANAVLKQQFPDCLLKLDVTEVTDLPSETELITAGFPCQNLSMAGDKSGIDGAKSGVVSKMFELIARSQVSTVVIENVYFMLQLDRGNAMRRLVEQFEALQYRWAYRVIDSMSFGLPQRRRRVYMVASRTLDPRSVLFADEAKAPTSVKPSLSMPLGFYWTEGRSGVGLTVDGIPPLKVGSAVGIPSAPAVLFPDGEVLMPSLAACERLQGFPPGWTAVVNGNHGRKPEWRLIGNSVSVPVARWVAERVKNPGAVLTFAEREIATDGKWPNAGWNVGNGRVGIDASDHPVSVARPSISTFRDANWTRLSDRALNGFIRRALEGGLNMPEGFLDALSSAWRKGARAA
jgi:DNA (cytosine-5)-methyltransferase 1